MAQWRVDNVNAELLKECKDAGLTFLGFGVESMSPEVLRSMKKHITPEQVYKAFEIAAEVKIRAAANLIFGDINETRETMNESLKWFFDNPHLDINLAMIRAIPDSEVWRYVIKKGLIKDKSKFFMTNLPNINFSKLSDEDYEKCERIVRKCSLLHYAVRGKELGSSLLDELYAGKRIYSFKVECPECKKVSSYKHYAVSHRALNPVVCKSCQAYMAVSTRKIFYKDYNFLSIMFYDIIVDGLIRKIRLFYVFRLKKYKLFRNIVKPIKKLFKMK
jgi:radical SAM superfamily enzyme YgiQ (UPF0313 family)